jgi:UDP-N-acetylmuramoylalanine--D-glutamate ligase
VVLFIEQEHLDVHKDMQEYVNAKANIALFQKPSDLLVYNRHNKYSLEIAAKSHARLVGYPYGDSAHVNGSDFYYGDQKICSTSLINLVGKHNFDNACAAIDAVWEYLQGNIDAISKGLTSFEGLAHRLQYIGEKNGVRYYDDSIATTPSSAIAALKAFDDKKIIILGGSSKGSDFSELANELLCHDVKAILIGDEAKKIAMACDAKGFDDYEIINNPTMEKVVMRASELANGSGVVLLSPASASFGLFKNYGDRGDQFTEAVRSL